MGKIDIPAPQAPTQTVQTKVVSANVPQEKDVKEVSQQKEVQSEKESFDTSMFRTLPIKQHLGIDATNVRYDKELNFILDSLKSEGIKSVHQLSPRLKEIELKIGAGLSGEERVQKIYQYIKLTTSAREALKAAAKMEQSPWPSKIRGI